MLERLELRNFQAHQHLRIVFDPHVTTIIGASDLGKSAIIRALKWLATNRPTGTDFINWEAEKCRVSLWVDGRRIRRTRGKTENVYELDKKVFRAFGGDVPPEITALLNTGDVNFQNQHDPPFWLDATGGQVSRNLNQIVNLGIIDDALAKLGAAARRAVTVHEHATGQLAAAKRATKQYVLVDDMDKDLAKVEKLYGDSHADNARWGLLAGFIFEAQRHTQLHTKAKTKATAGRAVVVLGRAAMRAQEELAALQSHVQQTKACKARIKHPPDIKPLKTAYQKAREDVGALDALQILIGQIQGAQGRLMENKGYLAARKAQLTKESGGLCPICQQPIKSLQSSPATST